MNRQSIINRYVNLFVDQPIIDNNHRGYFCEAMLAEALAPAVKPVSGAWYPWDMQIGDDEASFPERIRIQVKNSAALQTWSREGDKPDCQFTLKCRPCPADMQKYYPGIGIEKFGFMADVYILCHHPISDPSIADHRDTEQWQFFVLPVVRPEKCFSSTELSRLAAASQFMLEDLKPVPMTIRRRPSKMIAGIDMPNPVRALGINELSAEVIVSACV